MGEQMYGKYIKKLKSICDQRGFKLEEVGYTGEKKEYPLYKITINNLPNPKKTVCFSAGIHGDEIAGPLAVLKFLKKFNTDKYKGIKIIIFPVDNPTGFEYCKRKNFSNIDLNRHFSDTRLSLEDRILYSSIKNEDIFFFHSLHEDIDESKFYMYKFAAKQGEIYDKIIEVAKKYVPINTKEEIDHRSAEKGQILNVKDGSFEYRLFSEGVPYCVCTETPGKISLEKRVNLAARIMNLIVRFSNKYKD